MSERILLVEDDPRLAEMLVEYLGQAGFGITLARLGGAALDRLAEMDYDAVVLDLMLPDMDGLNVCRELRARFDTPVLMPKPFEPRELVARLRAIMRRRVRAASGQKPLQFGRLELDTAARTVRLDGKSCELTGYQFDLLVALAKNAGRVLSRESLMDQVKGEEFESFDRSIDVHISRIRAAIEDNPKKPRRIITVRAAGYVFAKAQD